LQKELDAKKKEAVEVTVRQTLHKRRCILHPAPPLASRCEYREAQRIYLTDEMAPAFTLHRTD
jgi:hypothetical protein